jgi:Electron transfer DM13
MNLSFNLIALAKRNSNYGLLIGPLSRNAHDVSGTVYAVSDDTFFIKDFTFDGTGSSLFH